MAARPQRYPSAAELDAYARRTAGAPLSIRIFPASVRVPQHRNPGRTVNGFDTRYSPRFRPGAYGGLLATVVASPPPMASPKGVVKGGAGRRTRPPPGHPYPGPRARPAAPPNVTAPASVIPPPATGGLDPAARSHPTSIRSVIYQINRHCRAQALRQVWVPPAGGYGGLAHPGNSDAPLPAYPENLDYLLWQKHHHHHHHHHQHQHQQAVLRMYSGGSGGSGTPSKSPDPPSSRGHPAGPGPSGGVGGGAGGGLDKPGSSPLYFAPMPGGPALGPYLGPPWTSVLVTPESDCCNPQDHAHHLRPCHAHHPQEHAHLRPCHAHPHASALSGSLRSLEFLIDDLRPPCLREEMLGRGYEGYAPIRLPVYR